MSVFVDTSAIYGVFDRNDHSHRVAGAAWRQLVDEGERLVTTSYVIVEIIALLQRRLGVDAVRRFDGGVYPLLGVEPVDTALHREAMAALIAAGRRDVSLVDWTSFRYMQRAGIDRAFAIDRDFTDMGFATIPG